MLNDDIDEGGDDEEEDDDNVVDDEDEDEEVEAEHGDAASTLSRQIPQACSLAVSVSDLRTLEVNSSDDWSGCKGGKEERGERGEFYSQSYRGINSTVTYFALQPKTIIKIQLKLL